MKIAHTLTLASTIFMTLPSSSNAQQGALTDIEIVGHVYAPTRLPPTDARVGGLQVPSGFSVQRFAVRDNRIFLTDVKRIYEGELRADGSIDRVRAISGGLPDGGQHPNRTLGFSPQGELFVTVGSTCNECREPNVPAKGEVIGTYQQPDTVK